MSRKFNVPAGEMLTQSRAVRLIFIDDKALFLALNPAFADPFAADWLASIAASEAYPTDEVREDEQQTQTEGVLQDMADARVLYKKTMYYVREAFPNNKSIWNEFGENDFEQMRDNQSKYAIFFNTLLSKINENLAELTTAGMPAGFPLEVTNATNKFKDDNESQDKTIMTTQQATQERNTQYNSTFEFWQRVSAASKIIFDGNPVKLNQYLLPEGPQPDPDINLKGKVIDSTGGAPLKGVTVVVKELSIETVTNYAGNYNFVSIPAGSYTLSFLLSGYTTQEIPVTILASGVVVQNVSLVVL